jgi:hypothetical protein
MDNKKLIRVIIIIFVLIVISVAVILILKKEKIEPNPIDVQCRFACESNQKTAFCVVERKVTDELITTCDELSKNSLYTQYNVETCPTISCEPTLQELDKTCVTGLNSTWVTPTIEGTCPPQENKFVRKRVSSDEPPVPEQICCFYYD